MNYKETTGISIEDAFNTFDKQNPLIYKNFKNKALILIKRGKSKTSAKMIINVIRWESHIDEHCKEMYRINDAFSAHYARKFLKEHPNNADLFELRRLRAVSEDDENNTISLVDSIPVKPAQVELFDWRNPKPKEDNRPDVYDL